MYTHFSSHDKQLTYGSKYKLGRIKTFFFWNDLLHTKYATWMSGCSKFFLYFILKKFYIIIYKKAQQKNNNFLSLDRIVIKFHNKNHNSL